VRPTPRRPSHRSEVRHEKQDFDRGPPPASSPGRPAHRPHHLGIRRRHHYLATDRNPTWYNISYYSGLAGIVTALIAALPGFVDYFTLAKGTNVNDIALVHMGANLAVVGLYTAAGILQFDNGALAGTSLTAVIVLHALGTGTLSFSGWLGGEMVFRHHVATLEQGEQPQEPSRQQPAAGDRAQPRGA
jgi:uncharacterized membrane protein